VELLLFLILGAAGGAFAAWTYWRRDLPVPGRWVPATMRAAAFALALLLLLDPRLPAAQGRPERWVLIDGSTSMAVPSKAAGTAAWDSARGAAERLRAEGARVLRFGGTAAVEDSALASPPTDPRSQLVPALERAAESGAREIVVVSDFRLEDPVAARAVFQRLGVDMRFIAVGGEIRNAGLAELSVPGDVEAGAPIRGEVVVFASGVAASDTVIVEVREEDRLVWSGRAAAPAPGRTARIPVLLPAPQPRPLGGEIRYEAAVRLDGDAYGADDGRVAYAVVDEREGALVAVSFAPDWELRHLLPVLARVTGLPTRGYLRVGDRFLPTGPGAPPVSAEEVAGRVRDAHLVVVHGLGAGAPGWARDAAAGAPRALVFARDPAGALAAGLFVDTPRAGEWYLDAEPPASPLAAALIGLPYPALPPLGELLPWSGAGAASAPLEARLRGAGPTQAALVLRERSEGRVAVALASGWWRWALRPGAAEEAYSRVWSAVAGWLLAGEVTPFGRIRPTERVVEGGAPIAWTGGSVAPIRVTVLQGEHVVTDTSLARPVAALRTPPLPPGSYRYLTRAGADSASGRFDVQPSTDELRYPRMALPDSIASPPGTRADPAGRPLRAHPVPWLILIGLLCGEWVTRRRKGLR